MSVTSTDTHLPRPPSRLLPPGAPTPIIVREGWPIIAAIVVLGVLLTAPAIVLLPPLGWVIGTCSAIVCLWSIWFFRDPERRVAEQRPGFNPVISPADGVIVGISQTPPPAELHVDPAIANQMVRVSVFMNIFDVHVNRAPFQGVVARTHYHPGKFFNASLDKASVHNERFGILFTLPDGSQLVCVQIAGLIARRIVCKAQPGDALEPGQRFGLIRFGSRVDVYLPPGVQPSVKLTQRVKAGRDVLAWIPSKALNSE